MGKGKQRKRQKKIEQQMQKIPISQNTVTAEEWTHIIANALMEVDKKKALLLEAEREKNLEIWHQALGIKDHSKDRNPKKIFFIFFNALILIWLTACRDLFAILAISADVYPSI